MLQSVEAVCRGIVEQAAAAAEAAQKDCAAWKAKYEAALDRCNQQEFKVSTTNLTYEAGYYCCSLAHTSRAHIYCLQCGQQPASVSLATGKLTAAIKQVMIWTSCFVATSFVYIPSVWAQANLPS